MDGVREGERCDAGDQVVRTDGFSLLLLPPSLRLVPPPSSYVLQLQLPFSYLELPPFPFS